MRPTCSPCALLYSVQCTHARSYVSLPRSDILRQYSIPCVGHSLCALHSLHFSPLKPLSAIVGLLVRNRIHYVGSYVWRHLHSRLKTRVKVKVWFYIALFPVRWTAQSALHLPPLADLFIPTPFSASLGSILAMQQLRNDYSLTFPPLSIARYSFIQLSRLRRREVKENAQTSKR